MYSFLKVESLREARCRKSWKQFKGYDSLKSTQRQASIREKKGPSLGKIQVKHPHQRSPHIMKFEDRSHEETERQQRCARSKAWNLARNIYKLKEKDKATFYFPAEEWLLPAASAKEPEERESVVDSGASMHMVSKRDLNSAELETMRKSRSPTTVMTANGEVRTREEATAYVKQLDSLVKVMLLAETPAVLSLGKLCEDHIMGIHTTGPAVRNHISPKMARTSIAKKNELRTIRCPWLVDEFFLNCIFTCFFNIFIAGFSF